MSDSNEEVISLDTDEEDDIPEVETCQKLVEEFASITGTDEACAQFFLQDRKWDLERSVSAYFEAQTGGVKVLNDGNEEEVVITFDSKITSLIEKGIVTEEPPKNFCFITWNIDGLDEKNLKKRTAAVASTLQKEKADIVFLQELVPETYSYLESLLPEFTFIVGGTIEYFTAILLRRTTVYFDEHTIYPFENSVMGRNLLCVQAHIGDAKLNLMTSHLESTGKYSKERKEQFKIGIEKMKSSSSNVTTIFGGDMNLRDNEVDGNVLSSSVFDLWEACGRRQECRWTWDINRNTNKQMPGRFKPRLRFDRVYMRQATPPVITPRHFGLVGLEKIPGTQSFPSDHWGIITHFEVIENAAGKSGASSLGGESSRK